MSRTRHTGDMTDVVGLLLAAGAGTRMGRPKALVEGADGTPWVISASQVLRDGGCDPVVVVLGAEAEAAGHLLAGEDVVVVVADDWAGGMGASLKVGLRALAGSDARAAVVHLVDLPDVGSDVIRRIVEAAGSTGADALARADYGRGPGHPVLLGREHWAGVEASAVGDRGARDYLAEHPAVAIDCSDLAVGDDIDTPGPMLDR
jgi:CTP:molybdopterin cytidylyltransferase MocA